MSNNPEPRLLEHHPWLMVRLSSSTVAAGIFLSLCLWALYDMRFVQRRKTILLVKLSYFACQLNTVTMYKLLYMQFRIIKPICLYVIDKINSDCKSMQEMLHNVCKSLQVFKRKYHEYYFVQSRDVTTI